MNNYSKSKQQQDKKKNKMTKKELKKEMSNYIKKSLSLSNNYTDIKRHYVMKQPLERLANSVSVFQENSNHYTIEQLNKIWTTFKRIGNLDAIIADAEHELTNLRK